MIKHTSNERQFSKWNNILPYRETIHSQRKEAVKCIMISIGRKLFEETDTPTESKIVDEDKVNKLIQRQSSWIGNIRGQFIRF